VLRPLLIIGLGGSGGKTIRAIKQSLCQRLENSGYLGGFPSAWQFLQFDITYQQDGQGFAAPMLAPEEFHSVVPQGAHRNEILAEIEKSSSPSELKEMLTGWGTPSSPPINMSPSMKRADARQASVPCYSKTWQAIANSISKLQGPNSLVELENIAKDLELKPPENSPLIFIFTSLGSSGSGLLIDTIELLNRGIPASWAHETVSFLYTPDVFNSLGIGMTRTIPANSLGAINELISYSSNGLSSRSEQIYNKFCIPPRHQGIEISRNTNILVGATNISNELESESMDEIFLKFGTNFGSAILRDEVPSFLEQQIDYVFHQSGSTFRTSGLTAEKFEIVKFGDFEIWEFPPLWAYLSLSKPILNQVANSKNHPDTWQQFWDGRRARPLVEAIPFGTEMRRSIITGWFMSSLFGLREINTHANGRTVRIWNPTLQTSDWSYFPDPLLNSHPEDANRGSWILPAILTSASIALCEFGATGDAKLIEAYKLLLYMGREVTTSIPNRDDWGLSGSGDLLPTGEFAMSKFLLNWVKDGTKPAERDLLDLLNFHTSKGDSRGEAMKAAVTELREQYKNAWEGFKDSHWSHMPETWELKDDIDLAFDDIHKYVSGLWTGGGCVLPVEPEDDWGIEDSKTTKKSIFRRFKR
jgi:hypothetical protein